MSIYQPVQGVGGALQENSFMMHDSLGVEVGKGGVIFREVKKTSMKQPLEIEMILSANPKVRDMLFGALLGCAERIRSRHKGIGTRLFVRCPIDDVESREYYTQMGFDDFDGDELFVLPIAGGSRRRRHYNPVGTKSIETDLRTKTRREEYLISLKDFGCEEHASVWLEERMKEPGFVARSMYYGEDYVGSILVSGGPHEANLEMICVETKWRGRGAASALIDEVSMELGQKGVSYLVARSPRRNAAAMRLFQKTGFQWQKTESFLLGKDM